jgi:hypothetical protein
MHLSDDQIGVLSSGKSSDIFEGLSRPRLLSEKDLEALSKGSGEDFEKKSILPLVVEAGAFEGAASRPLALTETDIVNLIDGKSGNFTERRMLGPTAN